MLTVILAVSAQPPTISKTPIRIGAIVEFTGPLLREGPHEEMGIKLALDHFGSEVAGRKIEVIVEDGATSSTVSFDKARKLVERDKVKFILSPLQEEIGATLAPYLEKNKVPLVGMRIMGRETVEKYNYAISPAGTSAQHTYTMGAYVYDKLGYRSVTLIQPDVLCSHLMEEAFKKSFEGRGGKVIQAQYPPFPEVNFAPYITAMKSADACGTWNPAPGQLRFFAQYMEMGMGKKMPLFALYNGGTFMEVDLSQYGDNCLGIRGNTDWAMAVDTPANKKFVADFEKKFGQKPREPGWGAYAAMQVIFETIKATKGDTTPEKLQQAMLNLKIRTAAGDLRFTSKGVGIYDIYITENVKVGGVYGQKIIDVYKEVTPP
jgi:branched-chain amino acid transport system substrate-binding protein